MMDININKFWKGHYAWKITLVLFGAFLLGISSEVKADGNLAIIKVNKVIMGVYDHGSTWRQTPTYSSGWFPADYNAQGLDCSYGASFGPETFGVADWYGPSEQSGGTEWRQWSYATFPTYTSSFDEEEIVVEPMTNSVRWDLPTNLANGVDVQINSHWGTPDPSKLVGTSDQTIEVTSENLVGINVKRKLFAWSQENHDNYVVTEYTITNNGDSTLNDFYLGMEQVYHGVEYAVGDDPEIPGNQQPDRRTWAHYYGSRPGDSLRIYYEYSADDPDLAGDQMGHPVYTQDGRLTMSNIHYFAVLHASEEPFTDPVNDVDDPTQPSVTAFYNPDRVNYTPSAGELPNLEPGDNGAGYGLLSGLAFTDQEVEGQHPGSHHRKNNDEMGNPDYSNLGNGFDKNHVWNSRHASFGPYESFGVGESIRIVYITGIDGLGLKKDKEIGEKWLNDNLEEPPGLPDDRTGYFPTNFAFPPDATEKDKTKDRWISTVIDSVHQTVSRAKWNFNHDWQVPMAPPPTSQEVVGTGEGIEITWSNPEAEDMQNFDGYRIMRSVGYADTVFFEEVHRTDPADKADEHFWADPSVVFGASYYYYIQAGLKVPADDPNAHPDTRGKTIWSGRMFSTNYNPVESERKVGTNLDSIRIVPNPYNLKDPLWSNYGLQNIDDPRRIMFFNLPTRCTIKIFTENLDLVKTIEHTDEPVSTGYEKWDMLTENQQAISSGVYIVVFQTPEGQVSYQKLFVAR
ncbi:MAG: hypothetical protein K9N46_15795 [Candidatus Marinimicrobia bacterium]|nr:hypothetical protein [Candidatus Neomarinimicrobiota bacterium]MCF7830285.1 hypothetical protein [Candidatus Neomarinimicrobiota bacterium]MCF7882194.1 hypothetical protein [Candidatus Neomarinimicrobiota bacterium]